MSGIAGIICSNPIAKDSIKVILERMLRSIIHRGPDDKGMAFVPYGGLGHHRLSIVDIAGGQQPFHHPEKPYILVFSGEIYNYRALRSKLEEKGVEFMTRSDAEVLMMMYDYYDNDMFRYLEGMYAFALWNGEKNELTIARDPLGEKPIYYEMDEHGISFASELKAILQARQSKPSLSNIAIQNYLALQYIPSPMTMFEGIFKLPPGYMLKWRVEDRFLEIWPTWVPDDEISRYLIQNKNISVREALDEFDERIRHSVELRVTASDLPVAIFLSGGLDSSLITALAKKYADYPLHTYSAGYAFSNKNDHERLFAKKVSELLGTVHHDVEIGPEQLDHLPRILWHLDEPLADPALLATYALARQVAEDFKVVLTGQGGNEIFGGYNKYDNYKMLLKISRTPAVLRKLLALMTGGMPLRILGWSRFQLLKGLLNNLDSLSLWQTYRNFPELERKKLLKSIDCFPDKRFRVFSSSAFEPYVQMQWDDLHRWLPNNLLAGLDKMTMAHNLEARAPFLDHNLAAWSIALPERLKWNQSGNKFLLREYAKLYLPENMVQQRKKSFNIPIDTWLYTRYSETLEEMILESPLFQETDLFSIPYVHKLIRMYKGGTLKTAQPVWNLLVLKTWYEVFTRCNSKDDIWELQSLRV